MGVMMGRIISSRRKQWVQVLNNKMPGTIKDSVQYQFWLNVWDRRKGRREERLERWAGITSCGPLEPRQRFWFI